MSSPIEVDLPVIDISDFAEDFDAQLGRGDHPVLAKLKKVYQEWGSFRLVNHGIPVHLLDMAEKVSRDILSLPIEVKEGASQRTPTEIKEGDLLDLYYRLQNFEAFRIADATNPAYIQKLCAKIWPQGNPVFSETMTTYTQSLSDLGMKVIKMILASLGLDANAFYHSDLIKLSTSLRLNGYPPNKIGEEGFVPHIDPNCLTIIYQDEVGGLEIRSQDGKWFNIKPLPHSFVINVGDSLKAWSNGQVRSAEHRVVSNGGRYRVSIGIFFSFPDEMEIKAPMELVDEDNPRRYKPFIYSHFRQEVVRIRGTKEWDIILENFAGV